jgi:hypothetical protein
VEDTTVVLATWRTALDASRALDNEPFLQATARRPVARLSPKTAQRADIVNRVKVSNDRGSVTFDVQIEPNMADGVIWMPRRAPGSLVSENLAAAAGELVDRVVGALAIEPVEPRSVPAFVDGRLRRAPVLLIDELDRTDEPFEAYLLEVLSDWQITIPEVGTVKAAEPPAVIITSNRTRELHDALKRRCLYHWIDHPSVAREVEIVRVRAPEVPEALARQVAEAVARLRELDVAKRPGVAETIDWSQALSFLGATRLEPEQAAATLGALVKDHEDLELVRSRLGQVLGTE